MKKLHALFVALLPIAALPVMPAQAALDCDNGFCVQSFYYTGTPQTFEVPDGIGSIRYEIYGASGARGGAGALAQGYLQNLPDQLIIQVGGAGGLGANRPGGYNGGGASGGSRNNEGAGGGASDIRLDSSLESRIVVAGGGGGGGGFAGGAGGAGGLLGSNGTDGQGLAGKGGTATEGGDAGLNNSSGAQPTAGLFGVGGAGGFGLHAGGGGGGGGWYGGGGGGGDDDETGYDGGGGGGGSSYAHPDYVTNSSFESGLNWGHGRVMLYYQMVPSVNSFTGSQTNLTEMSFDLVMNQNIQNLSVDDFEFASGSCQVNRVAIDLNTANIRLRNCTNGEIGLTLKAGSVGEWELGPLIAQTAYAQNDLTGPTLVMSQPTQRHSTSAVVIPITYSELVPTLGSFSLPNCQAELTTESLILNSCSEGVKTVSVLGSVASDSWGNVGPLSQSLSFDVDLTPPTFSHVATFSGVTTFSYQLMLQFSETVEIAIDAISFSSSMSCSQEVNAQTQVCGHGSVSWTVNLALITDLVGHSVGEGLVQIDLDNPAPQPEPIPQAPAPEPQVVTPTPAPAQPEPVAPPAEPQPTGPAIVVDPTPEPLPGTESATVSETATQSGDVTESESVAVEPVSASEEIELPVADPVEPWAEFELIEVATVQDFAAQDSSLTPAQSPQVTDIGAVEETTIEVEPEEWPTETEPHLQTLVAGPDVSLEQPKGWPWLEIAIATVLLGLIGFGAYRTIGK
jgi:hypothetical protein